MDASPPLVSPNRVCTVEDLPWVLSLAHRRYTRTPDPGTSLRWLAQVLNAPAIALPLRSDNAFLVAMISTPPWWPDEPEAHIAVLVADRGHVWETIPLLRQSIAWARGKGCVRWWLSSETEYEFAALAKRVGATPAVTKYRIDL